MSDSNSPMDTNIPFPSVGDDATGAEDGLEETTASVAAVNLSANAEVDDSDEDDIEDDDEDTDDMDLMSMLPPEVLSRVESLKGLNDQRSKIMEHYLKERAALESKYQGLCNPLYEERTKIVQGLVADVTQTNHGDDGNEEEEASPEQDGSSSEEKIKGIPQFWVCAIGHMELVAELVEEADVDCLEHLLDVKNIDDANGEAFTLEFHFEPNDYFHNTILTKRYEVPNLLLADEPILKSVKGCDIQWKEGKSLISRETSKKQRSKSGKNAGKIRTVVKKERAESFFHFFSPPKMPAMDDMDEEQADQLEESLGMDYDVAQAFRSHIVPKAVLWFTGEAMDADVEDMLDEGEWPGDGGDRGGGEGGSGGADGKHQFPPGAQAGQDPEECKQS